MLSLLIHMCNPVLYVHTKTARFTSCCFGRYVWLSQVLKFMQFSLLVLVSPSPKASVSLKSHILRAVMVKFNVKDTYYKDNQALPYSSIQWLSQHSEYTILNYQQPLHMHPVRNVDVTRICDSRCSLPSKKLKHYNRNASLCISINMYLSVLYKY